MESGKKRKNPETLQAKDASCFPSLARNELYCSIHLSKHLFETVEAWTDAFAMAVTWPTQSSSTKQEAYLGLNLEPPSMRSKISQWRTWTLGRTLNLGFPRRTAVAASAMRV